MGRMGFKLGGLWEAWGAVVGLAVVNGRGDWRGRSLMPMVMNKYPDSYIRCC